MLVIVNITTSSNSTTTTINIVPKINLNHSFTATLNMLYLVSFHVRVLYLCRIGKSEFESTNSFFFLYC